MTDKTPPKDLLDWLGITNAPNWWVARPLGGLFALLFALLLIFGLIAAFALLGRTIMGGFETEVGNLGAGALIVALLGAPFLVWSTVIKQKTVEFQKESHITERISKAVEQLGEEKTVKEIVDGETVERTVPNIEVRIGGLLLLERIAQDSTNYDKGRDHVRVMEILCAYVRENAPASGARDFPLPDWESLPDEATEEEREAHLAWRNTRFGEATVLFGTSNASDWAQSLPKPRADIALALQIIGRRTPEQRRVEASWGPDATADAPWVFDTPCPELAEPEEGKSHGKVVLDAHKTDLNAWKDLIQSYRGYRVDLRKTNLQGADLSKLILSGADLSDARMEGAILRWARMEGAILRWARMEGAELSAARMEGADLSDARMEGADLSAARMEAAILRWARMEAAYLGGARMEAAYLGGARMEAAYLSAARMEGAYLGGARMEGADLGAARMEAADLGAARMEGADLSAARMEGAYLGGARMDENTSLKAASLRGAALREVTYKTVPLSQEQIKSCFGDASVIRPKGIDKPDHWPDWELPIGDFYDERQKWRNDPDDYEPPKKPEGT